MYLISDINILSSTASVEILDSKTMEKFKVKQIKRYNDIITVKPTRPLKKGTLSTLESEIISIIKGGWSAKRVKLVY